MAARKRPWKIMRILLKIRVALKGLCQKICYLFFEQTNMNKKSNSAIEIFEYRKLLKIVCGICNV